MVLMKCCLVFLALLAIASAASNSTKKSAQQGELRTTTSNPTTPFKPNSKLDERWENFKVVIEHSSIWR